jgi:hypothetical protein
MIQTSPLEKQEYSHRQLGEVILAVFNAEAKQRRVKSNEYFRVTCGSGSQYNT